MNKGIVTERLILCYEHANARGLIYSLQPLVCPLKWPLHAMVIKLVNKLILKYHACKVFVDASASSIIHDLQEQHYEDNMKYENLEEEVLNRFIYTECNEPLIAPIAFSKHGERMIKVLQKLIGENILRVHVAQEKVITALKSAKSKPNNTYALDRTTSAFLDTLDALRLAKCAYS